MSDHHAHLVNIQDRDLRELRDEVTYLKSRLERLEDLGEAPARAAEISEGVAGYWEEEYRGLYASMTLLTDALEGIFDAIDDPGAFPKHHSRVLARHRVEWPTLWERIDTARKLYEEVVVHE